MQKIVYSLLILCGSLFANETNEINKIIILELMHNSKHNEDKKNDADIKFYIKNKMFILWALEMQGEKSIRTNVGLAVHKLIKVMNQKQLEEFIANPMDMENFDEVKINLKNGVKIHDSKTYKLLISKYRTFFEEIKKLKSYESYNTLTYEKPLGAIWLAESYEKLELKDTKGGIKNIIELAKFRHKNILPK